MKTQEEIYRWLDSKQYQKERDETMEYTMYFELDMPKILNDFLEAFASQDKWVTDEEILNYWKRNNCTGHYLQGLIDGSEWMRNKLSPKAPLLTNK